MNPLFNRLDIFHVVEYHKLQKYWGRAKLLILTFWYSHRRRTYWILCVFLTLVASALALRCWASLDDYLSTLEKTTFATLAISIGAAITGIIAIAFSLSLFAIQQVAERGTPATLQAYARDPVLRLIYWALAAFATACFAISLLKNEKNYRTGVAVAGLVLLFVSFILLNLHFKRVVKFADPRYTVLRIFKNGQKQLKTLRVIREKVGAQGRVPTTKH